MRGCHPEASYATASDLGNPRAAAVVRCIDSRHVLLTLPRVLTPATVFLKSKGASNAITIVGGDLTKVNTPRA
jgi:hypothetical protein